MLCKIFANDNLHPQLPVEEEYDLSDVDMDDFDKDELWAQTGKDHFQTVLFGSGLVRTLLPSPVDEWEARLPSYWNTPEKTQVGRLLPSSLSVTWGH